MGFGRRVFVIFRGRSGTAVMAGIAVRNPMIIATKLAHLSYITCM